MYIMCETTRLLVLFLSVVLAVAEKLRDVKDNDDNG